MIESPAVRASLPLVLLACLAANLAYVTRMPAPTAWSWRDPSPLNSEVAPRPLPYFEPNRGQAPGDIEYLSQGPGYQVAVNRRGVLLAWHEGLPEGRASVLRLAPVGGDPSPSMNALRPLQGKVNYLIGEDPTRWQGNVPTFRRIRYEDVFLGIDLEYYGARTGLEYDFVVHPHADAETIALDVGGADAIEVRPSGDLSISVGEREIVQTAPVAYQVLDGERHVVPSRYRLEGTQVSFALGPYDRSERLVIDPVLKFSTYYGGGNWDEAGDVAVDALGNVYITGKTSSSSLYGEQALPTTRGAFDRCLGSCRYVNTVSDAFVAKFGPDGRSLIYATYLGGEDSHEERGTVIAVHDGHAFVTGTTFAQYFPTTPGAFQHEAPPGDCCGAATSDAFVTKLNRAGSSLVYSTYLGSLEGETDVAEDVAVDASGAAYVGGWCGSATNDCDTFPTTPDAPDGNRFDDGPDPVEPNREAFVTKFTPSGSALAYSFRFGGPGTDFGMSIGIANGAAYLTGEGDDGFFTTAGAFDRSIADDFGSVFVTKVNSAGTRIPYSTYLDGSAPERGHGIAADGAGSAYVVGYTSSADFPVTMETSRTHSGDAFVTKLNATGSGLVYSRRLGGSSGEDARAVAVDDRGRAYVTGGTSSPDFPTTPDAFDHTYSGGMDAGGGGGDAFVTRLGVTGRAITYSTYLGGTHPDRDSDIGYGIELRGGSFYVAGMTTTSNFPTTASAFDRTYNQEPGFGADAFVTRFTN